MRILSLATMTVAFIASVASKFSFGPCRDDVPQLSYDDYTPTAEYNHKLFAIDKGLFDLAYTLENLGFRFPVENWRCDDLVTISPFKELAEEQETDNFYFDEETFDLWFPDRPDAVLKYVKNGEFDSDHTDIIYMCADTFSVPAIIE
jgi:hypothetical protein